MEVVLGSFMGIAYMVSPGPVNIATVRCGLRAGFYPALILQLGALFGDTMYTLVVLAGFGLSLTNGTAQLTLAIVGM